MKTPSNFTEIVFSQATFEAALWKPPQAFKECKEDCQFFEINM
jgi:hypothetical protein